MPVGIIVNVLAVALGGSAGALLGRRMPEKLRSDLTQIFGICSLGMGIQAVTQMQNMPAVILSVVLGTAIGLLCGLGSRIERGAAALMRPFVHKAGPDGGRLQMMVTVLVLFCASGTGIYGCLDLGMTGDSTVLISKSVLDLFTAAVFGCTVGPAVALAALPQLAVFLLLFFGARLILPLATPVMIADFKACGGFLLLATAFRVAKIREFPIADMIPAMVLAMPMSWLWVQYIAPLL